MKYLKNIETIKTNGEFHVALNSLPRQLVVEKSSLEEFPDHHDYSSGRTRMATILVENEAEYSYYSQYINSIKDYFDIDAYTVGNHHTECLPIFQDLTVESYPLNCVELLRGYKFVILPSSAFEDHYVTDRLRMAYAAKVVPILLDIVVEHTHILPNSSYIDLHTYDTLSKLAKDMMELNSDAKAYNRFFEWVDLYDLYETRLEEEICKLCSYIRELDRMRRFQYDNK